MKNYYAILGIQPNATQSQIVAKYRLLAKELHPDKHPENKAKFEAAMLEINEAYETLKSPSKRNLYDLNFKVRRFSPKESGTFDVMTLLTDLVKAKVPANVVTALSPALEHFLEDRGISPRAASPDQILQACGLLKKRRAKRA